MHTARRCRRGTSASSCRSSHSPSRRQPCPGLPPAAQAYIRELEAQAATNAQHIAELTERIKDLEEQFRLAQSKRFAPSSEKLKDRAFDEAEQMATTALADDDEDGALAPPDTGLPEPDKPAGRKRSLVPLHCACASGGKMPIIWPAAETSG